MIFIRYTGWVPEKCDCSSNHANNGTVVSERNNATMSSSTHTSDATTQRHRRRLAMTYDNKLHAHGVTHHGATFQTTPRQDEMIAKLTELDELLYQYSRDVFAEQVQEVEEEFKIKVCDKIRE
jgi:hypothetical protein